MKLTKYASAAFCRHIMVLPSEAQVIFALFLGYLMDLAVRRRSYLIRNSVLFWNCQISWRATVPDQLLPGLFDFSSLEEFLLGGFASHSRSELPPGWLLPQSRWPGLCSHLGQLSGWQWWWGPSHIIQLSCLLYLPLSLFHPPSPPPSWVRAFWQGMGGAPGRRASFPSLPAPSSCLSQSEHPPLPSPLLLQSYFCSCHSIV